MRFFPTLSFLRDTRLWRGLRDWRYVRQHRARQDFYRQFVRTGALVFDIGANVGHYTLLFERIGARVLAVEPQAALAAGLRRRFAGRPRVRVLQIALGPAPSTAVRLRHPPPDMIRHTRERLMNFPILLVPDPPASVTFTLYSFRSMDFTVGTPARANGTRSPAEIVSVRFLLPTFPSSDPISPLASCAAAF